MGVSTTRSKIRLWASSLALVLVAYAYLVWLVFHSPAYVPMIPPPVQEPVFMLELAPLPSAPPTPQTDLPVGPQQEEQYAASTKQIPPVQPPLELKAPVVEKAKIVLPKQTNKSQEKVKTKTETPNEDVAKLEQKNEEQAEKNVQQTSAPSPSEAQPAKQVAASQPSAGQNSQTVTRWQAQVLSRLDKFKRYPRDAQFYRKQGVTVVTYTVNRQGTVLQASVLKSSGNESLDLEAVAAVKRASPLPAPPDEIMGDPINVSTAVNFFLQKSAF
jgi:protein TonB